MVSNFFMIENIEKFISEFAKSLGAETFVKMTLGNYRGNDAHLQKSASLQDGFESMARLSTSPICLAVDASSSSMFAKKRSAFVHSGCR